MYILATGNIVDGMEFYGPFEDADAAIAFAGADGVVIDPSWWVVELTEPIDGN
jgi:hypothetical protein